MTHNKEIEQLIERYFDCTASEEEESRLRSLLANPSTEATPAVEEARAVMGYTTLLKAIDKRPATTKKSPPGWLAAASVAAAVAVAGTLGWHIAHSGDASDTATVYACGRVNHSTDQALDIMAAQLGAIGEATSNSAAAEMLNALQKSLTTSTPR